MAESSVDDFGIRKIYRTNTHPNRAKPWFLGIGDWEARKHYGRGDWEGDWQSHLEDGFLVLNFKRHGGDHPGRGRNPVTALLDSQYPEDFIETDQSKLRKRGYMGTPEDWKNVEMTLYARVRSVVDSNEVGGQVLQFLARGGAYHGVHGRCQGTAYHFGLRIGPYNSANPDCQEQTYSIFSFVKELRHTDGYCDPEKEGTTQDKCIKSPINRWIGIKGIIYNKSYDMIDGIPRMELWFDENADNNWQLINAFEDTEQWYIKDQIDENGNPVHHPNLCEGYRDERIIWGGPSVIFRWDNLSELDIKWASVREIIPPTGYSLRYFLNWRGISFPVSMRGLAAKYGLTPSNSVNDLVQKVLY